MRTLTVAIVAALVSGPPSDEDPAIARRADAMRTVLAAEPGYAGVFGLASDGDLEIDRLGDVRTGVPHAVDQPIRWASVSKMITAILVFQQVEAGRLSLDAPVATYLPHTTLPNAERITVRQLLAHKSGLGQQSEAAPGPPGPLMSYCTAAVAEPGSAFAYNNCDTIVLGEILEAVTGLSLASLIDAQIGSRLGITITLPDGGYVDARMADGSDETEVWPTGYGAAGGLYGTVEDLLKVDMALMEGRLISPDSLATMLQGDPGAGFAALGVWSYEPDLGSCIGKTRLVERYGEIGGVQVRNFLLPDKNLALAVYSNDRRTDFGEVWRGEGLSIDLIRAAACDGERD